MSVSYKFRYIKAQCRFTNDRELPCAFVAETGREWWYMSKKQRWISLAVFAVILALLLVGIILTGMGQDGAAGLLAMRKKGAYTIGQDKESCVVYGMPMVAKEIGAVCIQASCDNVANVLLRHLKTLG
jgi:hypothetical protein